jgi:chromosomal replication initiation ATPase DnaA
VRVVRQLPPADQRLRELVIGQPGAAGRTKPEDFNRRTVELMLERAGIESVLADTQRRIGELQEKVNRMHAQLASMSLGNAQALPDEQRKEVDRVCQTVFRTLGIQLLALTAKQRSEPVCWARFIAQSLSHERAGVSSQALGRYLSRDHGSILSALRRTSELRETCPKFREQYDRCAAALEREGNP